MQNENTFIHILTRQCCEYPLRLRSCISLIICNENRNISRTYMKRTCIKLLLTFLLISIIYFFIILPIAINSKSNNIQKPIDTRTKAYIITNDCKSLRFLSTKENIERGFPNFFNIICHLHVPLTDPRIHYHPLTILKLYSSNLITFIDLWTYTIPNESENDYDWTFIFEDDVNFINASNVSLTNYIAPLKELMNNPEIQQQHGFFYLGICDPAFDKDSKPLTSKNGLLSRKGCGSCFHASAITTSRSRLFWAEVSSYRPNLDTSIDRIMLDYCVRSRNHFYTFGANFLYPLQVNHYGIAYQDRKRFIYQVN